MGPPQLLVQQLRRAHSIFLLLHDFSMTGLYNRVGRSSFCLFLDRFWGKFTWNWEVLLSGNPIVDMYNGIKLAAGGELGIGVGEEEWGSGEREVLEDFVSRTDGLLDLVVSRFGDPPGQADGSPSERLSQAEGAWLGSDTDPRPADGVVFSGAGAVDRRSLARVSQWMEWIYRYGDAAYGIGRDPTSLRRRKPRRKRAPAPEPVIPERAHTPGIPRPLVMAMPQPPPDTQKENTPRTGSSPSSQDQEADKSGFGTDTVMKYLTLGYGSAWSFANKSAPASLPSSPLLESSPAQPGQPATVNARRNEHPSNTTIHAPPAPSRHFDGSRGETKINVSGRFVLGPRDDLDTLDDIEEGSPGPEVDTVRPKARIVHRSVHVHLSGFPGEMKTLQAVIYVVGIYFAYDLSSRWLTFLIASTFYVHFSLRPKEPDYIISSTVFQHPPPTRSPPKTPSCINIPYNCRLSHLHTRNSLRSNQTLLYTQPTGLRHSIRPSKPNHPLLNPQHPKLGNRPPCKRDPPSP